MILICGGRSGDRLHFSPVNGYFALRSSQGEHSSLAFAVNHPYDRSTFLIVSKWTVNTKLSQQNSQLIGTAAYTIGWFEYTATEQQYCKPGETTDALWRIVLARNESISIDFFVHAPGGKSDWRRMASGQWLSINQSIIKLCHHDPIHPLNDEVIRLSTHALSRVLNTACVESSPSLPSGHSQSNPSRAAEMARPPTSPKPALDAVNSSAAQVARPLTNPKAPLGAVNNSAASVAPPPTNSNLALDTATSGQTLAVQPTRASLRMLIDAILLDDADLDAFCLDHFFDIYKRFARGMVRVEKINLLLVHAESNFIIDALREQYGASVERRFESLRFE